MPERHKAEPAYDPADWQDADLGNSGEDPLAELARLVQGIGNNPGPAPLRPAPPRHETGTRSQSPTRYDSYAAPAARGEPAAFPKATPPEPNFNASDLASDLETELMRDLQASFAAVRAPMETPKQPDIPTSNLDELDFDAFADMHMRRSPPAEPPPAPKAGIESIATWREQTRPRPRSTGPSFRQRLAESAADPAPLRPAARDNIRYDLHDPLTSDPDIAAVAAVAESFGQVGSDRHGQHAQPSFESLVAPSEGHFDHVPGYGPESDSDGEADIGMPRQATRRPLLLIGSLLGLVVVGALGFFMMSGFGGSGAETPPLIAADTTPTKIRPENPGGGTASAEPNKLIYDRVGGDASDAALAPDDTVTTVSRPETQQTEASRQISRIILPNPADPPAEEGSAAEADSAVGPKRVRTVVVRPDGTIVSSTSAPAPSETAPNPAPEAAETASLEDARPASAAPQAPEPEPVAATAEPDPVDLGEDWESGRPVVEEAAAPVGEAAPAPVAAKAESVTPAAAPRESGPISLLPKSEDTPAPRPEPEPEPEEVAAIEPVAEEPSAPQPVASGGYFVQVSSQRTENAALAAYREVQRRFPSLLGDRQPDIRRADLGSRGIFYRARVSPGMSSAAANKLCASIKSAGGDCIVTDN